MGFKKNEIGRCAAPGERQKRPGAKFRLSATISEHEAVEVAHKVLTVGQEEFSAADSLVREGKIDEATGAFKRLQKEYKDSWIDRVSSERLAMLEPKLRAQTVGQAPGLAAKYHGDA